MQSARGFEYGVRHIVSPQSGTVCDVLISILQIPNNEIKFLLDLGAIYLNHHRLKDNSSVSVGDYLRVHTKPRRFPSNDGQWKNRVVFANEHFVIANKISGVPVHGSVDNLRENLHAYLSQTLDCELFITHRLDVPTRGLIVYAKNIAFQSAFNKLLIAREVKKIYHARVEGTSLRPGALTHYMEPSPRAPKKVHSQPKAEWQECVLEILNVTYSETKNESDVRILLHTGRTHQIRAQLSFEKSPIVGDHAYGAKKLGEKEEIELTACELEFTNPLTGEKYFFRT